MSTPIVYLAKQDFKKSFVLDELRKRGVTRTSKGKSIESEDYRNLLVELAKVKATED